MYFENMRKKVILTSGYAKPDLEITIYCYDVVTTQYEVKLYNKAGKRRVLYRRAYKDDFKRIIVEDTETGEVTTIKEK